MSVCLHESFLSGKALEALETLRQMVQCDSVWGREHVTSATTEVPSQRQPHVIPATSRAFVTGIWGWHWALSFPRSTQLGLQAEFLSQALLTHVSGMEACCPLSCKRPSEKLGVTEQQTAPLCNI